MNGAMASLGPTKRLGFGRWACALLCASALSLLPRTAHAHGQEMFVVLGGALLAGVPAVIVLNYIGYRYAVVARHRDQPLHGYWPRQTLALVVSALLAWLPFGASDSPRAMWAWLGVFPVLGLPLAGALARDRRPIAAAVVLLLDAVAPVPIAFLLVLIVMDLAH